MCDTKPPVATRGGTGNRAITTRRAMPIRPLRGSKQPLRSALHAVADALAAHGFATHTESRNNQLRIVQRDCPFVDTAIDHPVICAVDRGMVKGMPAALYGDSDPSLDSSRPQGDTFCVTTV